MPGNVKTKRDEQENFKLRIRESIKIIEVERDKLNEIRDMLHNLDKLSNFEEDLTDAIEELGNGLFYLSEYLRS